MPVLGIHITHVSPSVTEKEIRWLIRDSWRRHKMETFSAVLAFVRGIHRSPVNSPHKGQWHGALMFSLICALNKRLKKQSWGWWFETPSRSLWRHCNVAQRSTMPFPMVSSWHAWRRFPHCYGRGFLSQRVVMRSFEQAIKEKIELTVTWDDVTLIWRHCDVIFETDI